MCRTLPLLTLVTTCALTAGPGLSPAAFGADTPKSTATPAVDPPATVGLVDGQAIVGKIVEASLRIRTSYGVLTVPMADVIKVRLSPRLAEDELARFEERLRVMEKKGADSQEGREALRAVKDLGISTVPLLSRAIRRLDDVGLRTAFEALIEELRSGEEVYVDDLDEIVAKRFTIRGDLVAAELHIECVSGTLAVPRTDIVHITFRELAIKKVWKIGPQYTEQESFLDTKFKVKKGQKITLAPSGTMTYNGQSLGPGGLPNHTWNGRRMGCLQWRIGGDVWQVLEGTFEGRAPQSGTLQFCVHTFRGNAGGEFKVELRTRKK